MNTFATTLTTIPVSEFKSTVLNGRVTSYALMADRVRMTLGAPLINIEIHDNQIFDNIAISCEFFTKYAGFTEEYLVFDVSKYEKGMGIRMDKMFSITPYLTSRYDNVQWRMNRTGTTQFTTVTGHSGLSAVLDEFSISDELSDPVEYSVKFTDENFDTQISKVYLTTKYESGSALATFIEVGLIHTSSEELGTTYVKAEGSTVTLYFMPAVDGKVTVGKHPFSENLSPVDVTQRATFIDGFDADLDSYRKVVDVFSFEEGSSSGINTLFTIEQSLAQQTYFSYSMGNYGFDLISWYVLKNWLETRAKLLNTNYQYLFNPSSQYMKLIPEPDKSRTLFGMVGCYVEKPIRELVKEPWVYQYALALTKISVAYVRSKYSGTTLLGGGSPNGDTLMQQGIEEKKRLEDLMLQGAAAGFGDADPPQFFVG